MAEAVSVGRITKVAGPVVDVEFPREGLPEILHSLEIEFDVEGEHKTVVGRGGTAPGPQPGESGGDGADRRPGQRVAGPQHRRADLGPGGGSDPRAHLQHVGRLPGRPRHRVQRRALADPPSRPALRGCRAHQGRVRDRHQGARPDLPLPPGRQDRPVRRRRRGQDGAHPGDDQPGGHPARRRVGVRRGGGAHQGGERPLPRDVRDRGDQPGRPRLRPDGRAPGSPPPGGPVGADHGRVLQGCPAPGRAAVHRQHLPLHPGRFGSLDACWAGCPRRWDTSPPWPARWASSRSASPR